MNALTNDEYAALERDIALGRDLDNARARALLAQLKSNAADHVRTHAALIRACPSLRDERG